jgi:hypothetical protein
LANSSQKSFNSNYVAAFGKSWEATGNAADMCQCHHRSVGEDWGVSLLLRTFCGLAAALLNAADELDRLG